MYNAYFGSTKCNILSLNYEVKASAFTVFSNGSKNHTSIGVVVKTRCILFIPHFIKNSTGTLDFIIFLSFEYDEPQWKYFFVDLGLIENLYEFYASKGN